MYTKEQRVKALQALISASINLYRIEELHRAGFIVHQDKQVLNRTISMLKRKDYVFNRLDSQVDTDELLKDLEDYIDVISSVPTDYYRTISDVIKNDIIEKNKHPLSLIFENAFRELLKDKSITEQSEIRHLQRKIERYI